jgi:hypothetical protein
MERDRDNEIQVVICRNSAYSFQSKQCKWIAQVGVPIVFEGVDQLANRPFIEELGAGGIKMRGLSTAGTAAVIAAASGKRNAAERAEW